LNYCEVNPSKEAYFLEVLKGDIHLVKNFEEEEEVDSIPHGVGDEACYILGEGSSEC
jgi:hypothetical protein